MLFAPELLLLFFLMFILMRVSKRFLVVAAALVVVSFSAMAQTHDYRGKGYKGSVSITDQFGVFVGAGELKVLLYHLVPLGHTFPVFP